MQRPIFVIGKNRSGTKWLSNIIAGHPDVGCVQGEDFTGILETNLFFQFPLAFGDLRQDENYCAMAACFSKTCFFKIMGLEEQVLFEKKIENYNDFFRHIMDVFAENNNKACWVQKSNPLLLKLLYAAFPDALFIIISRNITDSIRSSIALAKHNGIKGTSILSEMALYHLGEKLIARYRSKPNVMCVRFEDLMANKEKLTRSICDFLLLDFDARMLNDSYRKNTSFESQESRESSLSRTSEYCIALLGPVFSLIPVVLLKASRLIFGHNLHSGRSRFIQGTFLTLRKKYGWTNK